MDPSEFECLPLLWQHCPLGYDCSDFWLLFLYTIFSTTCAHAGSHLCTHLHCCMHRPVHHHMATLKYTVNLHNGYACTCLSIMLEHTHASIVTCTFILFHLTAVMHILYRPLIFCTDSLCIVVRNLCTSIPLTTTLCAC